MIVVASVHHTGTNFVWQDLLSGLTEVGMNYGHYGKIQPPENGFTRIHCDLAQYDYLEWWLERYNCVVPLRHPMSVAASWKARGEDLSLLPFQWEILKNEVDPHKPSYLPMDVPERDKWLAEFNERNGLNIHTDWPVIMSCNKSAELSQNDRQAVIEVMADGFFDRFGYEDEVDVFYENS